MEKTVDIVASILAVGAIGYGSYQFHPGWPWITTGGIVLALVVVERLRGGNGLA